MLLLDSLTLRDLFSEPLRLEIQNGETVEIRGPSGAGKSSLLRCLAWLESEATGLIRFEGKAVTGDALPAYRARALYLHQTPPRGARSCEEYLRAPFAYRANARRGLSFDPARCRDLMEETGLASLPLERGVGALSGGEMQRLALVRALLLAPRVLLLDEVSSGLDQRSKEGVFTLLGRWRQSEGRALVYVSHDASMREALGGRSLLIRQGVLVEELP